MDHYDENGNWIETFRSTSYPTEQDARNKIKAVIDFHVNENGWILNGQPKIEKEAGGYVAIIPLMKPAETKKHGL